MSARPPRQETRRAAPRGSGPPGGKASPGGTYGGGTFLPLYLAGAWTLLAIYGSLYPFAGWRDTGVSPLAFLFAGWPRYYTGFDLTVNTLAYVPIGFLWATVLSTRLPRFAAFAVAALLGALLSGSLETTQNFLPSRVPSNLDLATNTLGAFIGAAAGMRWGAHLLDGGRLHAWREHRFLGGATGDHGLMLVALWLLTQLNPETFLFGNGNLRGLIGLPAALSFEAGSFIEMEMATVAAQTLAIALIGSRLARNHPVLLPLALLGAAMLVKSFALMLLMQSVQGFAWVTPGTLGGLAIGMVLWAGTLRLTTGQHQTLAALALMLATVLANLMPDNPYLENTLRVWQQGHFLNFNGATRLASSLWPFLALPWLMLSRRTHERNH
ncbi:MAG: VanZ family protein [Rhodocyclaceae bacterium]|nr:VanZ family protein [Rhodocyclaceae bacterium]MDP3033412.1 VanZ family protein [Rhodocyclaceae bacterium]